MSYQSIINAHNPIRGSNHKCSLRASARLGKAAQSHANWMAQTQRMSHEENVQGRVHVGDRVHKAGYNYQAVAENIAFTSGQNNSVPKVMNMWMNSPGHRENILNGNYNQIGAAVARASDGSLYWCVVFGRR
ncbi:unnamed protein product [Didymodactylos carnosus]|uniref:SCP domain-containing protein n=1 Tax=Didymodactylos carnosus TaxID=1234261 RepID=A0A816E8I8_9BILA|nr:unnamed protein product [Didymodactylos carnosus]CAF4559193.1 unnamed protein product [Didymodactylos carnosus]